MMRKNRPASLKEQIYKQVLNDIIEGVYKPSEILNEKPLIEKYGVSKSPVRDALIELCKEGVLRSHPRYGYEIVRVNEQEIEDIINFRLMIEPLCLRQAMRQMEPSDIKELQEFVVINCRTEETVNILQHWENNKKFHLKLNSYSGNRYCYSVLEHSMNILTRAYAQNQWDRWKTTSFNMDCEGHLAIVRYMAAGDTEKAVDELSKDILNFEEVAY